MRIPLFALAVSALAGCSTTPDPALARPVEGIISITVEALGME